MRLGIGRDIVGDSSWERWQREHDGRGGAGRASDRARPRDASSASHGATRSVPSASQRPTRRGSTSSVPARRTTPSAAASPRRPSSTSPRRQTTPPATRRSAGRTPASSRTGRQGPRPRRLFPLLVVALVAVVAVVAWGLVRRAASGDASAGTASTIEAGANAATAASDEATTSPTTSAEASGDPTTLDAGRTTASGSGKVSFCAFGDNLANKNILDLADGWGGSTGDGNYDFSPLYRDITSVVQNDYDVALVNQETTLGGTDGFDYAGYPSYNTPDSMAKAVSDAGFRVVNTNTNHTYDTWVNSIRHSQGVWAGYTNLITIGSYASEQDRNTVHMVECNGIRIAFLSYSYGQNGYEQSDLPNDYYAVPYTEEGLATDIARAKSTADAVVVYMHWGIEYKHDPSEEERHFAQCCADDGADLVVGSHVHVIQSMEWVNRSGGGQMLCVYGLGDFVSGYHNNPACILSGMFSCNFVRGDGDAVEVRDVVWHPLVEHWENGDDRVCLLRDYDADKASKNELLSGEQNSYQWCRDTTTQVIGDQFTIDM